MWDLHPVFQPIVRLSDTTLWGVEALIRPVRDGLFVSPPAAYAAHAATPVTLRAWDRRVLQAIRSALWRTVGEGIRWPDACMLTLNVRAATLALPAWLAAFTQALPVPAHQVVWEYAELDDLPPGIPSWPALAHRYPDTQWALDDWGAGHQGWPRVEALQPLAVKLAGTAFRDAASDPAGAAVWHTTVQRFHAAGCFVIVEGVETAADVAIARALGADAGQGFFWQRPTADLATLLSRFAGPSRLAGFARRV